ncbi:dehydratase [Paramixta manurensis]|uniref:Dehydratase n=1 Tax=Paramixta manurensis TaxID=2740817 RepID=A0A6M8UA99_9GAMM|nr:dehydratase [Erwiniaceae bacterium PD-1]
MFIEKYFEDFIVDESRTTIGRTITESDIVIHAGQTGDFYPHHMDAEWCKTQPFGQRIAHGTLTFAIAVGMTAGEINSRAMTYGYEKLRFPAPVFIGDTLRVCVHISEKKDHPRRPGYGVVTEQLEVVNQRNECVMATQHLLLVEKRQPENVNSV